MSILTIVLEAIIGLVRLLRALVELETARSRREECHSKARRPRHHTRASDGRTSEALNRNGVA